MNAAPKGLDCLVEGRVSREAHHLLLATQLLDLPKRDRLLRLCFLGNLPVQFNMLLFWLGQSYYHEKVGVEIVVIECRYGGPRGGSLANEDGIARGVLQESLKKLTIPMLASSRMDQRAAQRCWRKYSP